MCGYGSAFIYNLYIYINIYILYTYHSLKTRWWAWIWAIGSAGNIKIYCACNLFIQNRLVVTSWKSKKRRARPARVTSSLLSAGGWKSLVWRLLLPGHWVGHQLQSNYSLDTRSRWVDSVPWDLHTSRY